MLGIDIFGKSIKEERYFVLEVHADHEMLGYFKRYLVNGWNKSYHFFTRRVLPENYFKTRAGALKSWKSIVKMEPYYGLAEIAIKEVDILGNEVF